MNRSGTAVAALCRRYAVLPAELLVVCDDVHLPLGRLRARQGGSAGGHHGLESIIEALQSDAFPRLRLGIGEGATGRVNHVLGAFSAAEKPLAEAMIAAAARVAMQALATEWDAVLQAANRWQPAVPHDKD
jgi:PTH1 family peptidyl-tRNA hydrolase